MTIECVRHTKDAYFGTELNPLAIRQFFDGNDSEYMKFTAYL